MLYDINAKLYLLTEEEMTYLDRSLKQRAKNQKTLSGITALGVFSLGQVLVSLLMTPLNPVWFAGNAILVPVCVVWYVRRRRQASGQNEDFIYTLEQLRRTAARARPTNWVH